MLFDKMKDLASQENIEKGKGKLNEILNAAKEKTAELGEQIELNDKKKKELVCEKCGQVIQFNDSVKYQVINVSRSADTVNKKVGMSPKHSSDVYTTTMYDHIKLKIVCNCQNCGSEKTINPVFKVVADKMRTSFSGISNNVHSNSNANDYNVPQLIQKYFTQVSSKNPLTGEWEIK